MRGEIVAAKPDGGYVFVNDGHLTGLWGCYRTGRITLADVRVYLACREIRARRCGPGVKNFNRVEISQLTGRKGARASLNRLEAAGLLTFEAHRIEFPAAGGRMRPFPRRMLRYLARGASASLIATVFGHVLRCLFFHKPACHSGGCCKAKSIADTFGIDLRAVKGARAKLIALGWLEVIPASQWVWNRHGGAYRINLNWSESPPPPAAEVTPLPPPDSDEEPPKGDKDQEPETGVSAPEAGGPEAPASLADVRPEDLKDTARTLELHAQAVAQGLVTDCEADRLHVVAAAEHAMSTGKINPCGLFITMIKKKLWAFITQADEDRAAGRIKGQLFPAPACGPASRTTPTMPDADQLLVRRVLAYVRQEGLRIDPFYVLRAQGWTRDRWIAAGG